MSDPLPLIVRSAAARPLRERLLTFVFLILRAVSSRLQRAPALPVDPCRILVMKPCCLGDVLLTTPVIAALRVRYPRSVIHFAVGQYAAAAIAAHPHIDACLDAGPGAGRGAVALLRLWRRMRAGRYDVCVVLERSPLFALLPLLAGVPVRAGIDSAGRGFALNVRVPWDESLHEADLYLSVAGALGCPVAGHHLLFEPGEEATRHMAELWQTLNLGDNVAVIAPGGGTNPGMDLPEKRWVPERFAVLADRLHDPVGPGDRAAWRACTTAHLCARVHASMRVPLRTSVARRRFPHAAPCYGVADSLSAMIPGPTHLAVAVGCPVVTIFGLTSPRLYGPYNAAARVVRRDLPCSPCFVHGHFPPCPNNHVCMSRSSVEASIAPAER